MQAEEPAALSEPTGKMFRKVKFSVTQNNGSFFQKKPHTHQKKYIYILKWLGIDTKTRFMNFLGEKF